MSERDSSRARRKKDSQKSKRIVIWIILAVVTVALAVMKISEVDFTAIKESFSSPSVSSQIQSDSFPYDIGASDGVKLSGVNSKLFVETPSCVNILNPVDAKNEFQLNHGYSNPISDVSSNYIVTYDQGGNKISLLSTSKQIYETRTEQPILCAGVAKNGTVAVATYSKNAKSEIIVYSKSLKEKFICSFTYGYITDIALNSGATKMAVAVVNSENARLNTVIYIINIGSEDMSNKYEIEKTSVLDLKFNSGNVIIIGDNRVSVIKNLKKLEDVLKPDMQTIKDYEFNSSGGCAVAYETYSNASECSIVRISASGNIKRTIKTDYAVKSVSISGNDICALSKDKAFVYSSRGKLKGSSYCSSAADSVCLMSSKIYTHEHTYVQCVRYGSEKQ